MLNMGGAIDLRSQGSASVAAAAAAAAVSFGMYMYCRRKIPEGGPTRPKELVEALEKDEDIYYFGVGSNMSRTRLEDRSLCGQKIKPISMQPCIIRNCRLAFNLKAMPPLEPVMGSLEPLPSFFEEEEKYHDKGAENEGKPTLKRRESTPLVPYGEDECHGALIKLSAHDYDLVYKSEGGGFGKLQGYEEFMVTCIPYDKSQPPVKAVAYRVRDHRHAAKDGSPSKRYMTIIREGAKELGLSESYQKWLDEHPVQNSSRIIRKVGKYHAIFVFTMAHGIKLQFVQIISQALLFGVYVSPTEPRWKQIVGEVASVIVMLPTACLGFVLNGVLDCSGRMPTVLRKWAEQMDVEN